MNQNNEILAYLKQGHSLTPLDALRLFGTFRLGARIFDLKKLGHNIKMTLVHNNGKHYASYKINKAEEKKESYSIPKIVPESRKVVERMRISPGWAHMSSSENLSANSNYTQPGFAGGSLHSTERQELLF